ncbi:MAG: hypothetical protein LQ351_004965 [Letrouitia transgressa]|nr:MAG: hypothetical protein LQ351_004965 [Letrouitia transgressa]
MEEFNSETDSEYASYWRDWVGRSYRETTLLLNLLIHLRNSQTTTTLLVRRKFFRLRHLSRGRAKLARQQAAGSSVPYTTAPPLSSNEEESKPVTGEGEESQHPVVEGLVMDGTSPSKRKRTEVKRSATPPTRSKNMDVGRKDIVPTLKTQRAAESTKPAREISQASSPGSIQLAGSTSAAKGTQLPPPSPTQRSQDTHHLHDARHPEDDRFLNTLWGIGKAMARNISPNKTLQKPPPGSRPPGSRVLENVDEMDISEPLAQDIENETEQNTIFAELAEDFCACVGSLSIEVPLDIKSSSKPGEQLVDMLDDKDLEAMMNELDTAIGEFLEEEPGNQLEDQPQDKSKSQPEEMPVD